MKMEDFMQEDTKQELIQQQEKIEQVIQTKIQKENILRQVQHQ